MGKWAKDQRGREGVRGKGRCLSSLALVHRAELRRRERVKQRYLRQNHVEPPGEPLFVHRTVGTRKSQMSERRD